MSLCLGGEVQTGTSYIRWGRKTCESSASLIYAGLLKIFINTNANFRKQDSLSIQGVALSLAQYFLSHPVSVRFAGGRLGRGLTPPLYEDDLPTGTCLEGSALTPPEGFQQQLDKTWGRKKIFCSFHSQII